MSLVKDFIKKRQMEIIIMTIMLIAVSLFANWIAYQNYLDTLESINNGWMPYDAAYDIKSNYYNFNIYLTYGFMYAMSLYTFIISITSYKYIYKRDGIDFYHSLPITRFSQIKQRYISDMIIIMIPFIIVSIISFVITLLYGGSFPFFPAIIKVFLLALLLYNFILFMMLNTGSLVSFIINLIGMSASILFVGIYIAYVAELVNIPLSTAFIFDVYKIFTLEKIETGIGLIFNKAIFILLIIDILFVIINGFMYIKRPSEKYNSFYAFNSKTIFKVLYSFSFGIFILLISKTIFYNDDLMSYYIVPFIGGLFLYVILEFIISQKLKLAFKGIGIGIITMIVLMIFIYCSTNDVFNLAYAYPDINKVDRITVDNNYDWYLDIDDYSTYINTFEEPENIKTFYEYNDNVLSQEKPQDTYDTYNYGYGSKLVFDKGNSERRKNITISMAPEDFEYLSNIYGEEYKNNIIKYMQDNKFNKAFLYDDDGMYRVYTNNEDEEFLTKLRQAYIDDLNNDMNYGSYNLQEPVVYEIEVLFDDDTNATANLYIKYTYDNTFDLLEEYNIIDKDKFEVYEYKIEEDEGYSIIYNYPEYVSIDTDTDYRDISIENINGLTKIDNSILEELCNMSITNLPVYNNYNIDSNTFEVTDTSSIYCIFYDGSPQYEFMDWR